MKPKNWEDIKIKNAKNIFENFKAFSDGVRCLFLIQRHKEGGETNNSKLTKIITRNSKEYYEAILKLVGMKMDSEATLRIYACVNKRDFNKAIHKFKVEQLDADLYHQEQKENFYLDARNRFIGCLMQPTQKAESFFLFDVDNEEGRDVMGEFLQCLDNEKEGISNDLIVHRYSTKNGWHFITKPFNHTKIQLPKNVELKKDALLLLDY